MYLDQLINEYRENFNFEKFFKTLAGKKINIYDKPDVAKILEDNLGIDRDNEGSIIDIATGGKLSTINRSTGMNTVGLLSQIGIMNPFSRKQESEADYLGLIFSSLSGYDIREAPKLWERMKKAYKGKLPPEFMSTHPSSDNRIKKLNGWMNEVILTYPPIKKI